jgi:hypothetical protein
MDNFIPWKESITLHKMSDYKDPYPPVLFCDGKHGGMPNNNPAILTWNGGKTQTSTDPTYHSLSIKYFWCIYLSQELIRT